MLNQWIIPNTENFSHRHSILPMRIIGICATWIRWQPTTNNRHTLTYTNTKCVMRRIPWREEETKHQLNNSAIRRVMAKVFMYTTLFYLSSFCSVFCISFCFADDFSRFGFLLTNRQWYQATTRSNVIFRGEIFARQQPIDEWSL